MKLLVYSDVHTEFRPFEPPVDVEYDVAILAGDIGVGTKGIEWANFRFTSKPVIYVHGNHEHYRHNKVGPNIAAAKALANPNIYVLDNDFVTIDGERFIGGTLWTDFKAEGDPVLGAMVAESSMNDFRVIDREPYGRFRAKDALDLHYATRKFLEDNIAVNDVVVTHHGPSKGSIHERYWGDPLNAAYVSDLRYLINQAEPKLWIHGHVHTHFDYMEGPTRIVANPRGYPGEPSGFDPAFVVEV